VVYKRPGRPALDAGTSSFEGFSHLVDSSGYRASFVGYNDVEGGFEEP